MFINKKDAIVFVSFLLKELSKITMPVVFNEPLSFLQRLTEGMEYMSLLDKACDSDDPVERIQVCLLLKQLWILDVCPLPELISRKRKLIYKWKLNWTWLLPYDITKQTYHLLLIWKDTYIRELQFIYICAKYLFVELRLFL